MMSIFLGLVFLIPLSFMNMFWAMQLWFFCLSFLYLLKVSMSHLFGGISWFMGADLMSFSLILLSFWVCSLMILASEKLFLGLNFSNFFLFVMIILMGSLFLTFGSMNLFVFYLFFEISLIPTLILIVGWGYQPERIEAGIYLLFYTLLVSLPMMIAIFYFYTVNGSLFWGLLGGDYGLFMYFCVNMVFFVKIPMFFVHLWLPKAHVEAPVAGSMILAGIMLKLGGYGVLRMMKLFSLIGLKFNFFIILISLIGSLFVSFICIRQSDIKSLIAYSSVAHMGMALAGAMTMSYWGVWGCLVMMIAHGLCSSGLFCLANLNYERVGSRSLYMNKGFLNLMPSLSLWWFLFCSSNMAAPPSFNLLGEIMLINSLMSYSWILMIVLSLVSFFSAVYSLFLYSFSQHGSFFSGFSLFLCSYREYLLLFLHWVPLNLLILKADCFSLWV
uniref:NADH-ubiquinone oxidoreductase chain 4 n=1 Tax=Epipedocera atra TaxID=2763313 RepID=A0A7G7WQ93_9CUCU|nr:NADH dehydrogenase subunit 4 [Epipedocera atra]QNH68720.1 NADH dehydrogenase subunit 4 [Epipedocera atra]